MGFKLGLYIRDRRIDKNLTIQNLSDLTEISIGYITYIETGTRDTSIGKLIKISHALDVDFKVLFHIYQSDQISKLTDDYNKYDLKACIASMESLAPESDTIKKLKQIDNFSNVDLQEIVRICSELDNEHLKKVRLALEVWFKSN